MKSLVRHLLGVSVFLSFSSLYAATLSFDVSNAVYIENLEYSGDVNHFQTGETFFGNILEPVAVLRPLSNHDFRAGLMMKMPFGDPKVINPLRPIIAIHNTFYDEKLRIIAGTLINHHATHEALTAKTLFYTRPIEYGLQGLAHFDSLRGEGWLNWQRIESSDQNEKFDTGWVGTFNWKDLFVDGNVHYIHMGGQRFSNGKSVTDDIAALLGLGYKVGTPMLGNLLFSIHGMMSQFVDRKRSINEGGNGIEFKAGLSPFKWDVAASWWTGSQFSHGDGDPLYQADNYIQFQVGRRFELSEALHIQFDGRLKQVDGTFVHSEGLLFSWNFSQPISGEL